MENQFSGWSPIRTYHTHTHYTDRARAVPVLGMAAHDTSSRDGRPYVCITHTIPIARARAVPALGMAAHDTSSRDGRPYVRSTRTLYLLRARRAEPVLGMATRLNS